MFKILQKAVRTGPVTHAYPRKAANVSDRFRGRPEFDLESWTDARPAAAACPTGAIRVEDYTATGRASVDYGRCVLCGQCEAVSEDRTIRLSNRFELAAADRNALKWSAEYALDSAGRHERLLAVHGYEDAGSEPAERACEKIARQVRRIVGRSLALRQVDAGSCNGCELEIAALNNPVHDIERFGIHFVASPRHADMLLVTGPVTRNMELALRKTYDACPEPRLVVAVGACGISGGIFGENYATRGAVDQVIPVDA